MKTLKITLLAAIFCTTLTGLSINSDTSNTEPVNEQVTESDDFTYDFVVNRHVKKGENSVPSNG